MPALMGWIHGCGPRRLIALDSVDIHEDIRVPLVITRSEKMKLYRNPVYWPFFQLQASTPRWHRLQCLLVAATKGRGPAPKTRSV